MAVVQNTLIGRARGRVGNAVFSTWKSLNILKQKPEIVTNPRSESQQLNRARFTALLGFGKLLRPILQQGYREYAGTMSWLNKFMSTNSANAFLGLVADEWVPDYQELCIAEGSLYPTAEATTSSSITDVTFTWSATPINNQTAGDLLFAVVIGEQDQTFSLGTILRSAGTATINLNSVIGQDVWIAFYFLNPTSLLVSSSRVAPTIVT
tara:strand:+ start:1882 stop:2508 length:627 start_codon:yes stop_codon:yes gene_type:complete